jgi:hypothetical protein
VRVLEWWDLCTINPEDIAALVSSWNLATSPRVNGGWIAKGWRNGHCYSESRDTLAEAVTGLVAQLEATTKTPVGVVGPMHSQNPTAEEILPLRDINQEMSQLMDTAHSALTTGIESLRAAVAHGMADLPKAPTFDDSVKKLADTWGKPSLSALDAEVERLYEAIDHTPLGPKPKPPEGTFAKTVIARQVQAVLGLRKPTEAELTSALYEALDGYEMSLVLVKMLRAQSKKVRAEGADPIITLAKIDALEDVIDLLLKA